MGREEEREGRGEEGRVDKEGEMGEGRRRGGEEGGEREEWTRGRRRRDRGSRQG